jgi:hypothetical protein
MKSAVALLTVRPSEETLAFAKELHIKGHAVYIVADDSSYKGPVPVIQYSSETMITHGYKDLLLYYTSNGRPCSWEKAMYHFCKVETTHEYVWFLEEDVFVSSATALSNIDLKCPKADLLCKEHASIANVNDWAHWKLATNKLPLPWFKSMVCACRISRKLFNLVETYAKEKKCLAYHEFLLNTLAHHNNLLVQTPEELSGILWKFHWYIPNIKKGSLYHPVKETALHPVLRKALE